jgi:hypothetical protein
LQAWSLRLSEIQSNLRADISRQEAATNTAARGSTEIGSSSTRARSLDIAQQISFEDFKLDGKRLATTHAKLTMQGFYKKFGEIETLLPNALAVAAAREYGNDNGIPLLTDDATRSVRKFLLQCGDNPLAVNRRWIGTPDRHPKGTPSFCVSND